MNQTIITIIIIIIIIIIFSFFFKAHWYFVPRGTEY